MARLQEERKVYTHVFNFAQGQMMQYMAKQQVSKTEIVKLIMWQFVIMTLLPGNNSAVSQAELLRSLAM